MKVAIDEVFYFDAITSHPSTGAASDADSTPTFEVFEESTDTDIGVGGNLTKRTSKTGNYRGSFTASAANGFEAGKWYSVIASATVNSIAGKGRVAHFQCVPAESSAGVPKVDVSHWTGTGVASPDTAGYPKVTLKSGTGTGEVSLSSGTVTLTDGSLSAAKFAAGAITSTVIATGAVDADALASDAVTEIAAGITIPTAAQIRAEIDSNSTRLAAIEGDTGTDLPSTLSTIAGYLDTEIAAIKAKTDNLPSDPADASDVAAAITAAWTTALTESYATDGSAATPAQLLYMILCSVSEFSISGTTITGKKLDGSTTAMTWTIDSATDPTSRTRAS